MKRVFTLLLSFSIGAVFAENTILAVVNNTPISYNSIEIILSTRDSYESKVNAVNQRIDKILQLQKAKELNIEPSTNDINMALFNIAEVNSVSMEELSAFSEFLTLKTEVSEKLSILNLQSLITKDIALSKEEVAESCSIKNNEEGVKEIRIAQIIISEIEVKDGSDKSLIIKSFLKKLSKHIRKGASFEAIARLHSQHPSYSKGGVTGWIEVSSPILIMLDSLKSKEVSKIYLTDFGYAIGKKLEERYVSSNLNQCKEKLLYRKAEKYYSEWIISLRDRSYIKIYHDKLQ